MVMSTTATTISGVILGLVPRTQGSASRAGAVRVVSLPRTQISPASGWLGPRDKPEDDNLCLIGRLTPDRPFAFSNSISDQGAGVMNTIADLVRIMIGMALLFLFAYGCFIVGTKCCGLDRKLGGMGIEGLVFFVIVLSLGVASAVTDAQQDRMTGFALVLVATTVWLIAIFGARWLAPVANARKLVLAEVLLAPSLCWASYIGTWGLKMLLQLTYARAAK
jgi:hypothetical protein